MLVIAASCQCIVVMLILNRLNFAFDACIQLRFALQFWLGCHGKCSNCLYGIKEKRLLPQTYVNCFDLGQINIIFLFEVCPCPCVRISLLKARKLQGLKK